MTYTPSVEANPPALSVLMPVYNAERYVGAAIDSVLGQTFRDFEFLIIDDGSTDGSAAIIEGYAARDPRIRFRGRENRGAPATRNELASMARAPLFAIMDSDDVCRPARFEKQMTFLEAHLEVDVVGSYVMASDEALRPIFPAEMPLDHDAIDEANLSGKTALVHSSVIMRRSAFEAANGYDEGFPLAQDLDLWLRLGEAHRLANLPDILLDFRLRETSLSGSNIDRQATFAAQACQSAWKRRGLPSRPQADAHWRPGPGRASRRDFALKWGWQAWRAGNRDTARHLFLRALRIDPLSLAAWKGLVFGTLRHPADTSGNGTVSDL